MFRKTILAAAATAALATAALTPTVASAYSGGHGNHGWHNNWRSHHSSGVSIRFLTPYAYAPACYTARRWVRTGWGWRLRRVEVCR
jgi:hypothetical protein